VGLGQGMAAAPKIAENVANLYSKGLTGGKKILTSIDNAVYPTRTYRAEVPGGNLSGWDASDLSKKVFKKGDFSTKNLDEVTQYLIGSETAGGRQGLVTGQDMHLTEYKVPFWKKNILSDPDVVALKKSNGFFPNSNEYLIPKNKLLYPRKTTVIKAVPEELKTFQPDIFSGSGYLPYEPLSSNVIKESSNFASKPYKYVEDQLNAVTGHNMPFTFKFDPTLSNQVIPIRSWKQPQFPVNKRFKKGGDLPPKVGVSYLPKGERSYYDPIMDNISLDLNASEGELNHEMAHAWQNRQDGFRSDPYSPKLRPSAAASDEQAATYFNRKGDDVDRYINNLNTIVPELGGHTWNKDIDTFIPDQIKYDKVIDPLMYSDPTTLEGEAEYMAQVYGRPPLEIRKQGGLHKFIGGGPIDCGEGYEWNEELQECVENTSKYNQQSLAKHLAEKKIYEDALKEIEAGTAEYAILEEAYNAKVKKLEKEKARVLKVRGNVIPASRNLDIADSKINTKNPLYQNFLNASNPKELKLARKALPQEIKNVLPNQGSYNVAKWDSKTNNWKDGSDPGRELYCTPYGCFAYQKAGASDVPIIGGNIDFANRAATGNFAFEKINPNERQLGDIALMVENAPNDYTDSNSGESRRPHHTTIYAGPDTNAPKDSEKGYFYNADNGFRLNFKKSYLATDVTPGDRFDYYRYVGAQNKINDEILDLAKQKEGFNIKQEQRKNNIALPSMATLEPKFITQNNIATLQYPKKEETLKPKNKKLFKKKSFKYGGLNKHEEEGMILDLSPEEIEGYKNGGYIDLELTPEEIEEYRRGGFTVEEIY
jgi:hypothetical protein